MNLNIFLNNLSNKSQALIKFFFNSKWTIPIIIIIIILYFIWVGMKKDPKEENSIELEKKQ